MLSAPRVFFSRCPSIDTEGADSIFRTCRIGLKPGPALVAQLKDALVGSGGGEGLYQSRGGGRHML